MAFLGPCAHRFPVRGIAKDDFVAPILCEPVILLGEKLSTLRIVFGGARARVKLKSLFSSAKKEVGVGHSSVRFENNARAIVMVLSSV